MLRAASLAAMPVVRASPVKDSGWGDVTVAVLAMATLCSDWWWMAP